MFTKVMNGISRLIFKSVLVLLYGKKAGETPQERAVRFLVVVLVLVIIALLSYFITSALKK